MLSMHVWFFVEGIIELERKEVSLNLRNVRESRLSSGGRRGLESNIWLIH